MLFLKARVVAVYYCTCESNLECLACTGFGQWTVMAVAGDDIDSDVCVVAGRMCD